MCEPMQFRRRAHFCVSLNNKCLVLGGYGRKNDNIEYFDGSHWTIGPKVPFEIHKENAQCILDRMGRVIILSNNDRLIIFDTIP